MESEEEGAPSAGRPCESCRRRLQKWNEMVSNVAKMLLSRIAEVSQMVDWFIVVRGLWKERKEEKERVSFLVVGGLEGGCK